jgi:hypothetical protein
MRGRHKLRTNKTDQRVWDLLDFWLKTIPTIESHYKSEKVKKIYFENSDLNVTKLYELFIDYFNAVIGYEPKLGFTCFYNYFNDNYNIGFSQPKTDVCNLCYECHKIGVNKLENDKKIEFDLHRNTISEYRSLKSELLIQNNETLVLEFDYSQNKPIPKLPVNEIFYSRLLWLFIFNIHVYTTNQSFMYYFLEGEYQKGPNSVISFIYNTLKQVLTNDIKTIVLFSDSCFHQNKNISLVKFLSLFSIKNNITIKHIYPIKGHSFCRCDSNFSLLSRKLKKVETIESIDTYIEALNTDFIAIKGLVFNFQTSFDLYFDSKISIEISKLRQLFYYPNGCIDCFKTYSEIPKTYNLVKNKDKISRWLRNLSVDKCHFVTKEKTKDMKSSNERALSFKCNVFYSKSILKRSTIQKTFPPFFHKIDQLLNFHKTTLKVLLRSLRK